MNKATTVSIDHLAIGYTGKHGSKSVVLSDICADIKAGELTCLLGANGVGKSTLLRTLSNFQPKLAGHIYIQGKEVEAFTPKELARLIGVVLTEKPDVANMTATDMVLMGRSPYTGFWGGCSKEDHEVAHDAIAMVGIEDIAQRGVGTLSDGERQKVMIAKALAQQTPIIYLDEPTAFLDYPSKVEIMRLLHRICREANKTIFLSTHDLELALQLADTIWLVDRERGISVGSPEDLSLDGSLAGFFKGRGVIFDPLTGLFRVASEVRGTCRIAGGDDVRRAMLKKALLRNGIAEDERSLEMTIAVGECSYRVTKQGTTTQAANIADVVSLVI